MKLANLCIELALARTFLLGAEKASRIDHVECASELIALLLNGISKHRCDPVWSRFSTDADQASKWALNRIARAVWERAMRNRMVSTREQWQPSLDDLVFRLSWAEAFLRDAVTKNRSEPSERARQKVEALRSEIREHRAKRLFD